MESYSFQGGGRVRKVGTAMPDTTDRDLAASVARGDPTAIGALYDRYGGIAFGLAFRIVTDDVTAEGVVQEAFLAVWRNRGALDASPGSLGTRLLATVRRLAIDRLRARRGIRSEAPVEAVKRWSETFDNIEFAARSVRRQQTRMRLAHLPADQRTTLELAYFEGYTCSEIAARLHLPVSAVRRLLRAGLLKLRALLGPEIPTFDGYGRSSSFGLKISE